MSCVNVGAMEVECRELNWDRPGDRGFWKSDDQREITLTAR